MVLSRVNLSSEPAGDPGAIDALFGPCSNLSGLANHHPAPQLLQDLLGGPRILKQVHAWGSKVEVFV